MGNCFEYSNDVGNQAYRIAILSADEDCYTEMSDLLVQFIDRMITERLGGDA